VLSVHAGDVLDFDFRVTARAARGRNLPYNISTPLLFHLARHAEAHTRHAFHAAEEVVERMVAPRAAAISAACR
jgi:16S rRNA (adenine1518-N6/adenine1519-N6)-dimethyltransferase